MAAATPSPSGFSYAQAAKMRPGPNNSNTQPSKPAAGAITATTAISADETAALTWVEDVESTKEVKTPKDPVSEVDRLKSNNEDESSMQMPKLEDKTVAVPSGVSSPDLASSASNMKEDDSSSAPNGSLSETTWETKSQASEPVWIAERKERQNGSQSSNKTVKDEREGPADAASTKPELKPAPLQEAAPPAVNPWTVRLEAQAKARQAVTPAPDASGPAQDTPSRVENSKAKEDVRRKLDLQNPQESSRPVPDARKSGPLAGKRGNDLRNGGFRQDTRTTAASAPRSGTSTPATWFNSGERQGVPNTAPPPSVKDEASWPTPDTAQEKERKESVMDKDVAEQKNDDENATVAKRKKPEWTQMLITPNIIWETSSMNESKERKPRLPGGERGGRGTSSARGRAGFRGGVNSVYGEERGHTKPAVGPDSDANGTPRSRAVQHKDRDAMPPPPPPRAPRATSANSARGAHAENESARPDRQQSEEQNFDGSAAKQGTDTRRSRSPKKPYAPVAYENGEDEILPKPIPRQGSSLGQHPEGGENVRPMGRESHSTKPSFAEGRKDRGYEREGTWPGSGSGRGKRNGRGRGGNGNGGRAPDFANQQTLNNMHGNIATDLFEAPFVVPQSPSTYGGQRGTHHYASPQFGHPAQTTRGGWNRANPRSRSIPVEGVFGRIPPPSYNTQAQLPPIQTFGPNMYDVSAYPLTAVPYQTPMDQHQMLLDMLATQVEYYFSVDNLLKDIFLRRNMDSQGFVLLSVIANFNRIKQLTLDRDLIKIVCINSENIEIRVGEDGKERLRRRDGWDQFLLPLDQRDPAAQTNGPQQLRYPERPTIFVPSSIPQLRGPAPGSLSSVHPRGDRVQNFQSMGSYTTLYGGFGQGQESTFNDFPNGEEARGRSVRSPKHTNASTAHHISVAAEEEQDIEPDAFPDEQANVLTVVVKMNDHQRPAPHPVTSRTFSNGSIDSASLVENKKLVEQDINAPTDGTVPTTNGGVTQPLSASRQTSPNNSSSSDHGSYSPEMQFFWVKDQDVPVDNLPTGLASEPYVQLRFKALEQRDQAATGTCPYDLDVLYQFWCHFLLRNFNNRMYSEFKYYANEDAKCRHNLVGLQNLVKFYSQALSSHTPIRDRVVKDYVTLVKSEPSQLEGSAFKQLRSAWRNGALNLKNRKKLADILDEDVKEQLDRAET